ncbi:exported protein of unknown function [Candidatus Nitrosotalea okcheonensis]|uniref:Uncharacterized protein n=1 Tax=Candidatus Nitrosotalea okcheonensis TaxID=1903276 RepID=A0A2H1FDY8_9ARCH|nr:exported protein of unknown function [Candidatus Nitrosotalea okcheonensis]
MRKSVIILSIILAIIGTGIVFYVIPLPVPSNVPQHILHCLQPSMESIPHMKWNCFYFTQK